MTKSTLLPNSLKLDAFVAKIMNHTNSYHRVLATIACWLVANKFQDREKVLEEPTVHTLALAEHFVYIMSAVETATDLLVKAGRLEGMAPYWSQGWW